MKTLHWHILRQVLESLCMTVLVFVFVLMLGESLKEILALLVNGQINLAVVAKAFALLVPYVLVFALPMGLLTSTLLVFGRMSSDQEITAARACGISLASLATPVVGLGVVCALLSAFINMKLAPECRAAYRSLLFQARAARASAFIPEKTFITELPGYILYAGSVEGLQMKEVIAYQLDDAGRKKNYLRAEEGFIELNPSQRTASLTLKQGWQFLNEAGLEPSWHSFGELQLPPFDLPSQVSDKPSVNNMSFMQLRQTLREVQERLMSASEIGKTGSAELRSRLEEVQAAASVLEEPIRVQMHRQASFSCASIGFALVGIPLAIRAHRRETSIGFALAIVLVIIYYSFFILAFSLETRPELFPHLLLWTPNFLFQLVGGWLLWKVNSR
ncbi:MAG: YjgP/YjgQ family permease [Verrucomicrobia bacterium]|nr:YjgP/YjgQ family permease [Verrucomicrobiota bacterium]